MFYDEIKAQFFLHAGTLLCKKAKQVSRNQVEVNKFRLTLDRVLKPRLLVEKPKSRELFQNTIQTESQFIYFNMNIASNNTFSNEGKLFSVSLNCCLPFDPLK